MQQSPQLGPYSSATPTSATCPQGFIQKDNVCITKETEVEYACKDEDGNNPMTYGCRQWGPADETGCPANPDKTGSFCMTGLKPIIQESTCEVNQLDSLKSYYLSCAPGQCCPYTGWHERDCDLMCDLKYCEDDSSYCKKNVVGLCDEIPNGCGKGKKDARCRCVVNGVLVLDNP